MKRLLPTLLMAVACAATASEMTDAEVRKIDAEAGKLTLRHGPVKHLDMPPMTMVFQVRDKKMLESLKTGDKVRVAIVSEGGRYVVTEIQRP